MVDIEKKFFNVSWMLFLIFLYITIFVCGDKVLMLARGTNNAKFVPMT